MSIDIKTIIDGVEWGWESDCGGIFWSRHPGYNWPMKPDKIENAPEEFLRIIESRPRLKQAATPISYVVDSDATRIAHRLGFEIKIGPRQSQRDLDASFVTPLIENGLNRAQVTVKCIETGWLDSGIKIATLYRRVGQIFIEAGFRIRDEITRATHRRNPDGEAALPNLLRDL